MCIRVSLCASSARTQVPAGHQMVPDLLELKLQVVMNHKSDLLSVFRHSSVICKLIDLGFHFDSESLEYLVYRPYTYTSMWQDGKCLLN